MIAVILNTSSTSTAAPERVSDLLAQAGIEAKIVTAGPGDDITSMARELADRYGTVVAGGGDGTVSGVAAALVDTDGVLGVLPLGGLNHFARDLGVPLDVEGAVRILKAAVIRAVDVAEVNGHTFINNSGLGLYPSLVILRERHRRMGQSKWIAFFRAGVATLRRFPFLDVNLHADSREISTRTPFVFVGNNVYAMEGIGLGTRQSLSGGALFLGVARYRIGRLGLVRLAFRALFHRLREEHDFEVASTKEVHIASRHRHVKVSLDGEVLRMKTPLHYRIRPGALKVIAP